MASLADQSWIYADKVGWWVGSKKDQKYADVIYCDGPIPYITFSKLKM